MRVTEKELRFLEVFTIPKYLIVILSIMNRVLILTSDVSLIVFIGIILIISNTRYFVILVGCLISIGGIIGVTMMGKVPTVFMVMLIGIYFQQKNHMIFSINIFLKANYLWYNLAINKWVL